MIDISKYSKSFQYWIMHVHLFQVRIVIVGAWIEDQPGQATIHYEAHSSLTTETSANTTWKWQSQDVGGNQSPTESHGMCRPRIGSSSATRWLFFSLTSQWNDIEHNVLQGPAVQNIKNLFCKMLLPHFIRFQAYREESGGQHTRWYAQDFFLTPCLGSLLVLLRDCMWARGSNKG